MGSRCSVFIALPTLLGAHLAKSDHAAGARSTSKQPGKLRAEPISAASATESITWVNWKAAVAQAFFVVVSLAPNAEVRCVLAVVAD